MPHILGVLGMSSNSNCRDCNEGLQWLPRILVAVANSSWKGSKEQGQEQATRFAHPVPHPQIHKSTSRLPAKLTTRQQEMQCTIHIHNIYNSQDLSK
ncbi:hypothetical protein ACLKA6_005339 [Drosophila palustris]